MFNVLVEDVKNTITELLKLYHDYIGLNEQDRELAEEMKKLTDRNRDYSFMYKNMMDNDPDAIGKHYKHVEALVKLTPALEVCIQDHAQQIEFSLSRINQLTQALNAVENIVKKGIQNVSFEELKAFNNHEKARAKELQTAFPELERSHDSLRLRFNTIQKELDGFEK